MSRMDTGRNGLERVDLFNGLPQADLEAIQDYLTTRNSPAGAVLFSEGDRGDSLYIVIDGTVRIHRNSEGQDVDLANRTAGDIFGEMALIDSGPHTAGAICNEDTTLLILSREKFFEVIHSQPEVAARILRVLVSRVREAGQTHLTQLEKKNADLIAARDRLAGLLDQVEQSNNNLEAALSYRDHVLSVAPFPVIVTDAENTVRLINPSAMSLFGQSGSRGLWKWVRPVDTTVSDTIDDNLARNTTWKGEIEVLNADDKVLICKLVAAPISDTGEGAAARLWVFEDLTERRFLENQQIQRDHLVTKGEMAGEIAHELNNYLAVLSGNSELLAMNIGNDVSDKIKKRLDNMGKSIERIRVFTDNLLNSRHPKAQRTTIDINDFLDNQIAFLKPQKKIKKITFETHFASDIPLVECDPSAMQQLFYNLILNAADAMSEQDATQSGVVVSTALNSEANTVTLTVADHGPGIAEDVLPQLFKERISTKPTGHGFGMLTIARIVRDHKGEVVARNRPEGGAEFQLTLPLKLSAQPEQS